MHTFRQNKKKDKEYDALLALVAIELGKLLPYPLHVISLIPRLGLYDEAEKLYSQCGCRRFDLLNQL